MSNRLNALDRELLKAFNYGRKLRGIGNDLVIERAARIGYSTLATITSGWYIEYSKDDITKEHIIHVYINEHPGWKIEDIETCSDVVFGGKRYKTNGPPKPALHSPRIWLIVASTIGKTV